MFNVKKVKLHTGLRGFESPSAYGVYKTTGGPALGVVGKDFNPMQPQFIFDAFAHSLKMNNLPDDNIEFVEIKDGSRIILRAEVDTLDMKNKLKKNDITKLRLSIMTGFDGRTKTSAFVDTQRLICENGAKAYQTEFNISFKNTKGNIGKANMFISDIPVMLKNLQNLKELWNRLSQRIITDKERNEFIRKVTGFDPAVYADLSGQRQKLLDDINASVAIEMRDAGATAWALMNGITRYSNHVAPKKGSLEDYIYADRGMFLNEKAQRYAIELLS